MLILEATQNEDDKLNLLRYAIENKYEISFWYRGVKVADPNERMYTKQNWRWGQPVALGSSAATGRLMLRCWQKQGVTNTKKPAWKTFLVDEMKSITVLDGEGGKYYRPFNRPDGNGYNDNGDMKMDKIITKINLQAKPGVNKNAPQAPAPTQSPEPPQAQAPVTPQQPNPVASNNNKQVPEPQEPTDDENSLQESSGFFKWLINLSV